MINPNLRAKDRIYSELPDDLKALMQKYLLTEEEHENVLETIKQKSYFRKSKVEHPKFIIVLGQTGAGKSHLSRLITQKDDNIVVIDSDKYKGFRLDSEEIQRDHLVEYAYLTAPDAYLHRDEMIYDAMESKYNILMECATSMKEGMFVDVNKIKEFGYDVEIDVMGVSALNSLLSVHERYEDQISEGEVAAKLTSVSRHDDSFKSLIESIKKIDEKQISIRAYKRGEGFPYTPQIVYDTNSDEKRFQSALEALIYTQAMDEKSTMSNFVGRYSTVNQRMIQRGAPDAQIQQLSQSLERYREIQKRQKSL